MERIWGLVAAAHTPMKSDGEVDLSCIEKQFEYLLSKQINYAFVCGTTGECMSLTMDERMQIAKRWLEVSRGSDFRIIVHVGCNCLNDAKLLASHAENHRAFAIAAVAPNYFKPSTVGALVNSLEVIASGAPTTPFYYYDIPSMTGISVSTAELLRSVSDRGRLKSLAGVKYTNPDLVGLSECLNLSNGKFNVLFGIDEMLLCAVSLGVQGAVGSGYNFAAPMYHQLLRHIQNNEVVLAQNLQQRAVEIARQLQKLGYLAASKEVMQQLGVPVGAPRLPLESLSDEAKSAVRKIIMPLLEEANCSQDG